MRLWPLHAPSCVCVECCVCPCTLLQVVEMFSLFGRFACVSVSGVLLFCARACPVGCIWLLRSHIFESCNEIVIYVCCDWYLDCCYLVDVCFEVCRLLVVDCLLLFFSLIMVLFRARSPVNYRSWLISPFVCEDYILFCVITTCIQEIACLGLLSCRL